MCFVSETGFYFFIFNFYFFFCYYYMYIFVSRVFSFFFCLCQTFFNATFLSALRDMIQTESGDPEPQKLHDPSNIECVTVNGSHSHSCIWMLTLLARRASTIHDFFFFFFTIPPRVGRDVLLNMTQLPSPFVLLLSFVIEFLITC